LDFPEDEPEGIVDLDDDQALDRALRDLRHSAS